MTQKSKNNENGTDKRPSELVVGLVTFAVFLVFMTIWMYFGTSG